MKMNTIKSKNALEFNFTTVQAIFLCNQVQVDGAELVPIQERIELKISAL